MITPNEIKGIKVVQDMDDLLECILDKKQIVTRYEYGNSMRGILENGEFGIYYPLNIMRPEQGDAVLCVINGCLNVHMLKYIIGSNEFVITKSDGKTVIGIADCILATVKPFTFIDEPKQLIYNFQ